MAILCARRRVQDAWTRGIWNDRTNSITQEEAKALHLLEREDVVWNGMCSSSMLLSGQELERFVESQTPEWLERSYAIAGALADLERGAHRSAAIAYGQACKTYQELVERELPEFFAAMERV
jgi:hypothetical protein